MGTFKMTESPAARLALGRGQAGVGLGVREGAAEVEKAHAVHPPELPVRQLDRHLVVLAAPATILDFYERKIHYHLSNRDVVPRSALVISSGRSA